MSTPMDNPALEWTRNDLIKLIEDARAAVESAAEAFDRDPAAMPARLSDAATCLHQTYGVLTLLELKPAATLVQHLEDVARAVIAGRPAAPDRALETLLLGILELPDHLEAQRRARSTALGPLLGVVNALRAHLGVEPLLVPIGQLAFSSRPDPAVLDRFESAAGMDKVRRLRAVYQQVLLAALRGVAAGEVVDTLRKVAQSLATICAGSPQAVLWQVFDEYLAAIVRDAARASGPLAPDTVRTLRRMDSELRLLAQEGAVALSVPVAPEHVRQLVAHARALGHAAPLLDALDAALASNEVSDALASTGRRALGVAAAALREDLGVVRDALDLRIRGGVGSSAATAVDALLAPLRRIASTMAMLGFESARAVTLAQIERLKEDAWTPGILDAIAEALAQIDHNLEALVAGDEPIHPAPLDPDTLPRVAEIRQLMPAVEHAVVTFAGSNWSPQSIERLPAELNEIAAGLRAVELVDAARVIAGAARHVVNRWQRGETPDIAALDQFAGAITGIDYYLQRLTSSAPAGAADALAFATDSLRQLDPDLLTTGSALTALPQVAAPAGAVVAGTALGGTDGTETALVLSPPPVGREADTATSDAVRAVQARLAALPDEADVDLDIRDVFLEEVDDLLAEISATLPRWPQSLSDRLAVQPSGMPAPLDDAQCGDEQDTAQVRRAFHSLKGSGRLVGARVMGELGAAIEATLNRVLDGSLVLAPATLPAIIDLVTASVPVINDLRTAFAAGHGGELLPVATLIERAESLAGRPSAAESLPVPALQPMPAMPVFEPAPTLQDAELAAVERDGAPAVITFDPTAVLQDTREIFLEEARDHLAVLKDAAGADPVRVDEAVVRALHTLAGGAGVVGETAFADLVRTALGLLEQRVGARAWVALDAPTASFFRQVVEQLTEDVDRLAAAE
ncbi:MAG: Hpt domain-containing protein, partial [Gammaproteobacteria bacterium]